MSQLRHLATKADLASLETRLVGDMAGISERLTGALLDRLAHRVHILEMNGESYRLKQSRLTAATRSDGDSPGA